jgi:hypothetical protein
MKLHKKYISKDVSHVSTDLFLLFFIFAVNVAGAFNYIADNQRITHLAFYAFSCPFTS